MAVELIKKPYEITFSRNPVQFRWRVSPYSSNESSTNTRVLATLFVEASHYAGDFREIKSIALRPDADGFCETDFSTLLDAQLSYFLPAPDVKGIQECRSQILRYYVRYSLVNDYEQLQAPVNSAQLHVLKGGIGYEQRHQSAFFTDKVLGEKTFLRYSYPGERVGANDPLYLYFLNPVPFGPDDAVEVAFVLDRALGLAVEIPILMPANTGQKWQLYCIAAGPTQQGFEAHLAGVGQYLKGYTVRASIEGATIATTSFQLYNRNHYDTSTLFYFNSLGGMDTLTLRGDVAFSAELDRQEITLLDAGAWSTSRTIRALDTAYATTGRGAAKGHTGFISKDRLDRLNDLLRRNQAWELSAGRMKPVRLVSKNVQLFSNKDKLYSLALDWEDAFADQNYTPAGYLAPATVCPAVEYLSIGQARAASVRVTWQLPDGYDRVQIFVQRSATDSLTIDAFGNSGYIDIDLPWVFAAPSYSYAISVRARVICDASAATFSAGPWSAFVSRTARRWAAPTARNDYATTYTGAGARLLSFPGGSIVANDSGSNGPGGILKPTLVSSAGTSGGTFSLNATTLALTYTPPSAAFSGTDSVKYSLVEQMPGGVGSAFISPSSQGTIYVTVAGGSTTSSLSTGSKPYLRIQVNMGTSSTSGSTLYQSCSIWIYFYKDPYGLEPANMNGISLPIKLRVTKTHQPGAVVTTFPDIIYNTSEATPYTMPADGSTMKLEKRVDDVIPGTLIWYSGVLSAGGTLDAYAFSLAESPDYYIL